MATGGSDRKKGKEQLIRTAPSATLPATAPASTAAALLCELLDGSASAGIGSSETAGEATAACPATAATTPPARTARNDRRSIGTSIGRRLKCEPLPFVPDELMHRNRAFGVETSTRNRPH
jgi:hypothetical protein